MGSVSVGTVLLVIGVSLIAFGALE
ncbi:MAG: hypothetical protein RI907_2125, partial [Pseudomonadota bacterium]